jgi:hypothetical protein
MHDYKYCLLFQICIRLNVCISFFFALHQSLAGGAAGAAAGAASGLVPDLTQDLWLGLVSRRVSIKSTYPRMPNKYLSSAAREHEAPIFPVYFYGQFFLSTMSMGILAIKQSIGSKQIADSLGVRRPIPMYRAEANSKSPKAAKVIYVKNCMMRFSIVIEC